MKNLAIHSYRFYAGIIVSGLFVMVWPTHGSSQETSEALKQRFLREAPSQWEEYVRHCTEWQGVLSVSHTGTLNNYQDEGRLEYKTNGRGKLLRTTGKSTNNEKVSQEEEHVFGLNHQYIFTLSRKSSESPWVLTEFFERGNRTDLGQVGSRIDGYLTAVTYGVRFGYGNEPLAEVVRKPEFQVGECRKVQINGDELINVNFTYSITEAKAKTILSGKLLFDPKRYWCWRSGEIRVTGRVSSGTLKLDYTQPDQAGVAFPLSQVWEFDGDWASPKGEWSNRQKRRYEVNLSQPSRLPGDEEFTLSAFGLPEPLGVTWEKQTPIYKWILVAAAVCVVLALAFRYLARRRALAQPV